MKRIAITVATALIFAAAPAHADPDGTSGDEHVVQSDACYVTGSGCVGDAIVGSSTNLKGETDPDRMQGTMDDDGTQGDWTDSVHGEWTGAVQGEIRWQPPFYPQTTAH